MAESRLKRIRKAAGLSQKELADRSGVNFRMLQHYEQGSKDLNKAAAETVVRLAETLHCSVKDVLNL